MPNVALPPDFPARLRAFRCARHLSESDLAEKSGLTYKTVHALEAGQRRRVMERTVLSLAEALGLALEDLVGRVDAAPPGPAAPAVRGPSPRRIAALAGSLLAVLFLAFGGAFLYGRAHADWTLDEHVLSARDAVFGIKLWEIRNDAGWRQAEDSPWDEAHILVGTGSATPDGGRLLCLARTSGDTLWSVGPDVDAVVRAFGPEIVGAAGFSTGRFAPADTDGDGQDELVVRFVHGLYYPCCLCLVDRDGNLLRQYANRGHLSDFLVEDMDGDGKDEVVAWGTNNAPDYQGFTVLRLDEEHWSGASVDERCNPESTERDGAEVRVVVPAYPGPYMDLLGHVRLNAQTLDLVRNTEGDLVYSVRVGGGNPCFMQVMLDEDLRPLRAEPTDSFLGHMRSTWADSLVDGKGPADAAWREAWLASGRRFTAGRPVALR